MSELEMIARWRLNDPAAWREARALLTRPMHWTAFRVLKNDQDAEDIVSAAFFRLHRALTLGHFRGESSLKSYACTIARNRALNLYHFNRRRRAVWENSLQQETTEGLPLSDCVADTGPGPHARIELVEFEDEMLAARASLPVMQRAIVEDLAAARPYVEIAARHGIHVGTVKSRVARAREQLRARLAS